MLSSAPGTWVFDLALGNVGSFQINLAKARTLHVNQLPHEAKLIYLSWLPAGANWLALVGRTASPTITQTINKKITLCMTNILGTKYILNEM